MATVFLGVVTVAGAGLRNKKKSMSGAFLLPALLLAMVAWGQGTASLVTLAQLDAAESKVTATLAVDDPLRDRLLKIHSDTRAALAAAGQYEEARANYAKALAGAAKQAASIQSTLAEREVSPDSSERMLAKVSLAELEQRIQVSKAELAARKTKRSDIQDEISGMPGRAAAIRERLIELGIAISNLQSLIALEPKNPVAGSEVEAGAWLAGAQLASAESEKAALDVELLSQPMRLQLLSARLDRANQDIGQLERQLQAMQRRDAALREGAATEALTEAQQVLASVLDKHPVVQDLAQRNTAISALFAQRGSAIADIRKRELVIGGEAEQHENNLKLMENRVQVLGMSADVGHVLRERQAQMPNQRETNEAIEAVSEQITDSNIRLIELQDESRMLLDVEQYVDTLVAALDDETNALVRDDLLNLASKRGELVKQAIELEKLYSAALGKLDFDLRRYAQIIKDYRHFIDQHLLWIPSRDPLSLFRADGLAGQLTEIFVAERWIQLLDEAGQGLALRPLPVLALLLVLGLLYRGRLLQAQIVASGREVGYVRTDVFSKTMAVLGLSLLLSIKWPLLLWLVGSLFGLRSAEGELGAALHAALSRGVLYFWGLEILRILLLPKGLVAAHFRWPAQRTAQVHRRVLVLERTLLPAVILVIFCLSLYPSEVGGPLGALAVIAVLLSIAHYFRTMPEYIQGKVSVLITDKGSTGSSTAGRLARQLLILTTLASIAAVFLGYTYTAMIFSQLLIYTAAVVALVFLLNELALRWLRMTRRRMIVRARAEAAQATAESGETNPEDEVLENDPELLSDDGTKLINLLTLLGLIGGIVAIWSEVFPALEIFDSVRLWHQTVVVDGQDTQVPVTLADILRALLIAVLGWFALRRIPGLLEILLRQRMGVRPASAYAVTRVFQYAATAALVIGVLSSLGGSWSQIQWAVAALSVGIGFGLQEIVANFISGLIILFEQPIRVGDTVTVGNISGRVTKIRIRATTIRDFDQRELLVPNKEFITQQLLNWSLSDQVTRWKLEVGVAYGSDMDKAMAAVLAAVEKHPLILETPEPMVTFEQFGDNSLLIVARFFMDQLDRRLQTSSEVMLDINRRLKEQGIVVAFPQRDVHLDTSQPLEIRMLQRESQAPLSVVD